MLARRVMVAQAAPAVSPYAQAVLADNPFAYWRFEETSGTTATDEQESHDGTVYGADLDVAGQVGSGISYDGTDDYVDIGELSGFGTGITDKVTIECWLKWSHSNEEHVGGSGDQDSGVMFRVGVNTDADINASAGKVFVSIRDGSDNRRNRDTASSNLNDGAWHHIVAVLDSGTVDMYVDGALDNGGVNNYGDDPTDFDSFDSPWIWGAIWWFGDVQDWFEGDMDEPALYQTALSAARVSAHYDEATA